MSHIKDDLSRTQKRAPNKWNVKSNIKGLKLNLEKKNKTQLRVQRLKWLNSNLEKRVGTGLKFKSVQKQYIIN